MSDPTEWRDVEEDDKREPSALKVAPAGIATEWTDVEEEPARPPSTPPIAAPTGGATEWQNVEGPATLSPLQQVNKAIATAPMPEKVRQITDTAIALRAKTAQPWEQTFSTAKTLVGSTDKRVNSLGKAIRDGFTAGQLQTMSSRAAMEMIRAYTAGDMDAYEKLNAERKSYDEQLQKVKPPATEQPVVLGIPDDLPNWVPKVPAGQPAPKTEADPVGELYLSFAQVALQAGQMMEGMAGRRDIEEMIAAREQGFGEYLKKSAGQTLRMMGGWMYEMEAGGSFSEIIDAGVDPAIAIPYAKGVGVFNALVEVAEVATFLKAFPGAQAILDKAIGRLVAKEVTEGVIEKSAAKMGKEYLALVAKQLGQELVQETAGFAGTNLAVGSQVKESQAMVDLYNETVKKIGKEYADMLIPEIDAAIAGTKLEGNKDFLGRMKQLVADFAPGLLLSSMAPLGANIVKQTIKNVKPSAPAAAAKIEAAPAVEVKPTPVSSARESVDAELKAEKPDVEKARATVEAAATAQSEEMVAAPQLTPAMINDAVELAEMQENVEQAGVEVKAKADEVDNATASSRLGVELPEMSAEETAEWDQFAEDVKDGKQTFEEFRAKVDPEGKEIAAEARPTIYEADLEGMMPDTAETVTTATLKSGETVTIKADGQNYYAEVDGKTVGYAMPLSDAEVDVSVAQEHQRKGVGKALLTAFREKNPDFESGGYTKAGLALEKSVFEDRAKAAPAVSRADTFINEFSEQYHADERQKGVFGKIVDALAENSGMNRDDWVTQFNPRMAELTPEIQAGLEDRGGIAGLSFQTPEGDVVDPRSVNPEEVKGRISAVYTALAGADFHHGIGEFVHMVERAGLNQKQIGLLEKAIGKPRDQWSVDDIEKIADNFEEYLGSGKAPSAELKSLFDELADIFYDILSWVEEHLGKENLSKEWRKAFDSWFKNPEGAMASRKRADMRTKDVSDLMKVGFTETEAKLVEANKLMVRDLLHFKPVEWLVDYSDREFAEVNNRIAKELMVVEHLFGPQDDAVVKSYPVKRDKRGGFVYQRGIAPQDLADIIYKNLDTLRKMFNPAIPIDTLAKDLNANLNDVNPKTGTPYFVEEVESLRNGKALFDDEFEDTTGTDLLSNNAKAGKSVDFILATCHPTTPCKECYAARAYIRMASVRKGIRNTAHVLIDPKGFAEKVAKEVNATSHKELPFVRLLGSGDITSTEQVDAFNHLAELIDRPLHIFSRHHDMLAKLKGTQKAPFIKMGSIDSDLYDHYGPEFLAENLEKRGINNAFLYDDPKAKGRVADLEGRHAVGLVLSANHKLHNTLPQATQKNSCPCDSGERTYQSSCRQCAMSQSGCFMAFADKGVDESGKVWRIGDEKAPDVLSPVLGFKAEPDKVWADIAEDIIKKSIKLIGDNIKKHIAAKKKGKTIGISLKDIRYEGDVTVVDNIADAEAYQNNLLGVLAKIKEGTFELPGGDIQPAVRYAGWVRMSDAEQWEKSATEKKTAKMLKDKEIADAALLHDSPESAHNITEPQAAAATKAGGWVDDAVLERYKGKRWVAEEIAEREDLRELASYLADTGQAGAYDTFTAQALGVNPTKKDDTYYRRIWESAAKKTVEVDATGKPDTESHIDNVIEAEEKDQQASEALKMEIDSLEEELVAPAAEAVAADSTTVSEELSEEEVAAQFERIESELRSDDPRIVLDDPRVEKLSIEVEDLQAKLAEQEAQFEKMTTKQKAAAQGTITDLKAKLEQARKDESTMAGLVRDEWKKKLADYKAEQKAKKEAADKKARLKRIVKKLIKSFMKKPGAGVGAEAFKKIREMQAPYTVKETKGLDRVKKSIRDWQAAHPGIPLVPEAEEILNKRTIKDLSVQELIDLYNQKKAIAKEGLAKTKEHWAKVRARRNARAMKLITDIPGGVTAKRTPARGTITAKRIEAKLGRKGWLRFGQEHPLRLLEILGPSFKEMFWDERKDNEGKVVTRRNLQDMALKELYKKTGVTHLEMIKKLPGTDYFIDTLMYYYGQMQDQDGRKAVLYGNDEDETTLSRAISQLPQKFKDFTDGFMDLNYKFYDDVEKVQVETKGVAATKVRKYLAMKREQQITGSKFDEELAIDAQVRAKVGVAKTEQGFTNERVKFKEGVQQPTIRTDFLNIIAEQIEKEATFVGLEEWNEDMRWLLGGKSKESKLLLEAMKQKHGTRLVTWLRDYVNAVVRPDSFTGADASGIWSRLFRNLGTSQLMGKLGSVLIQVEGPFRALSSLDYKQKLYLAAGLWKGTMQNKKAYNFMVSTDPVMAQIANYEAIDPYLRKGKGISNANTEVGRMLAYARQQEEQVGFAGLSAMAQWTVTSEWSTIYHAELAKTHDPAKAAMAARDAVYKHQPSGNLADAPAVYWRAQQNMILRYLMRFSRASNQMAQMMFVDFPREVKKGHIGKAQGIVVAAAISAVLVGMRRRKRHPKNAEELLEDGILMIADSVGAVTSGAGSAVISGLSGGFKVGEIKPLEAPYQAGAFIRSAVEGDIDKKQLWKLISLAGQLAGQPTPAIETYARSVYDFDKGDWQVNSDRPIEWLPFDPIELIGRRPKGE